MSADEQTVSRTAEPEIILQHYRRIEERHDDVEDSKAAETASIADAAASGVNVKALKHARKVVKMGPREGKTYLDDLVSYTNLISGGIMGQEELFANDTTVDDSVMDVQRQWIQDRDAERIGYLAGKNGEPIKNNSHTAGSSQHDKWARGWADGHEEFVSGKGTEIHPRKDSRRPEDGGEEPEDAS